MFFSVGLEICCQLCVLIVHIICKMHEHDFWIAVIMHKNKIFDSNKN